jgi:hypothetical protein
MTYDIKSVLSAWALMVFKFFHQVVILIFKIKFLCTSRKTLHNLQKVH